MNDLMFTFDDTPWERYVCQLEDNDTVGAAHLLALLEGESEDTVEEAFQTLADLTVKLDLADIPRPSVSGETGVRLRREADLVKAGNLLECLEDTDPLRLFLEEIASIPVCGDICLIASDLAKANRNGEDNEQLRLKLVNLSLSRVVQLAQEYTGWGVLLLDLIQEGSMGLWQATECFGGCGTDFESVRDWWIRFYLNMAVIMQARASGVGQKMRAAMEDYRAVDERLLTELGRNATIEEIAEELHMSAEETLILKNMLDNARMMNQAKAAAEPEEETEDDVRHVEDTALFQMRQRIMDLLSGLRVADAKLLTLRFGLEGGMPLSPEETGRRLGLTPEEVVAREAAALARLRNG